MSTQVKHRRGTAVQHEAFTGAMSEITHDTTGNNLRVHDGSKPGGYRTLMEQELGVANGIATLDSTGNVPEAQLGNASSSVVVVDNRAVLKVADTANKKVAVITGEGGRNGTFIFVTGDLSSLVAVDTQEGVYVAPDVDSSGASGAWVRHNDGKVFAQWFGFAEANSASDNALALTATFNFAMAYTGSVHISHGDYDCDAITITMTGDQDALHIIGDGYGKTNLRWTGTDGIAITMVDSPWWFMGDNDRAGNAVTVEKLSFVQEAETGAVGIALKVNGQNLGGRPAPFFLVRECVFRSDRNASCWSKGIELTSVSTATVDTCFWYGANADHTLGTFIDLIASVGRDASPYHVRGCEAYYFNKAINAGNYIEGLHVTDCDFVGGIYGIWWNASAGGGESQLCLHDTHINVTTRALYLNAIQDSQIIGNLLWCSGTDQVVCEFRDSSNMTVVGNVMQVPGANSSCIVFGSTSWTAATWLNQASTVDGNKFANAGIGVSLNTAVRNVTVGPSNVYDNITIEVNDVDNHNIVWNSERVSFTPSVIGATTAGTATYTTQTGWYKRCGDVVEFQLQVTYTGHTGTGATRISGLPINHGPSGMPATPLSLYVSDLTFSGAPVALMTAGSTQIILRGATSGGSSGDITIDAAASIAVSGRYPIDVS